MRRRPVSPSCSGPRLSTTSPGRRRNIGDGRREVRARELRGGAGWSPGKALGLPRPCQKAAIRSSSANPKPHLRRTGGPADLARPHGRPRRTRRQTRARGIIAGTLGVSAKVAEFCLVALNTVRNYCCAHHGRLWNKTLGTKPMIPRDDTAWHEPHEEWRAVGFGEGLISDLSRTH